MEGEVMIFKKGLTLRALLVVVMLLASVIGTTSAAMASSPAYPYSQNIAMVPDEYGLYNHGGTFPTTNFPNLPGGGAYTPSFTNLHPDNIRDDATCPIVAGGFDTVVLNAIEDAANMGAYLNDATFLQRIHDFVSNGGKLIIYTSETASNPHWANFVYPFETSNPGDAGYIGTPFVVTEENTLSSADPTNFYYINCADVTNLTDAVGDANVFISYDARWCEDMEGQNLFGDLGPVHAYAHYGAGLIIYNALDKDWLASDTFTSPYNNGAYHLGLIWAYELMQPWSPDELPCENPIGKLTLDCGVTTNVVGTTHCVTATVVDDDDLPVPGVDVTFTVTGDNPGGGNVTTDANGEAQFCYVGANVGNDLIVASCDDPEGTGITLTSNECPKAWTEDGGDISVPSMTQWGIIAAVIMLAALIPLTLRQRALYRA
jgi:hypothetical protein